MSGSVVPELKGRVALVIGGGSIAPGIGIGRAISMTLAREGALVIAADLDIAAAQETASLVAAAFLASDRASYHWRLPDRRWRPVCDGAATGSVLT